MAKIEDHGRVIIGATMSYVGCKERLTGLQLHGLAKVCAVLLPMDGQLGIDIGRLHDVVKLVLVGSDVERLAVQGHCKRTRKPFAKWIFLS